MIDDAALARDIGQRFRALRLQHRKSLQAVASGLGISYQQVRKYETGQNGISASMLFRAAGVLGVDVSLFFHEPEWRTEPIDNHHVVEQGELAVALSRIEDPEVRRRLADFISLLVQKT